jgi:large subunit ribosomal protein L2
MLKPKQTFLFNTKLKISNPITPGTRHYKYVSKNILAKNNNIIKPLIFKISRSYGKSNIGHTCIRSRASGTKKLYKKLFFFNKTFLGIVLFTIYDPNRTAFISAVFDFLKFKFFYIPAIHTLCAGSIIGCKNPKHKYFKGFRYKLEHHLQGSIFCFLTKNTSNFAIYAKSAGTFCQLLYKSIKICKVRLPSGQIITISPLCFATLGITSNIFNRFVTYGKAGRRVLMGFRPKVRGIAMNPVDHPHGGRTNGGCCWVTPWGKPFRFKKTSRSKVKKIFKLL